MTRILLIDDHSLFREAIARLLSREADFLIVGECATVDEGIGILQTTTVDMVLLDIDLGFQQGGAFLPLAREHGFDGALVLIRGPRGPDYASAAVENPVDLTSHAAIYVRDLNPETRAAVLRAFPNRAVWIVEGPTVTKSRYRVVEGPIPPTAAFHLP